MACISFTLMKLSTNILRLVQGVELIHSNQVSNIKAGRNMVIDPADFIQSQDRSLAFLPWAHSYGQVSVNICT